MGSILLLFIGVVYEVVATKELRRLDQLLERKARIIAASAQYTYDDEQWQIGLDYVPLLGDRASRLDSEVVYAHWYGADGTLLATSCCEPSRILAAAAGFQTVWQDEIYELNGSDQENNRYLSETPVEIQPINDPISTSSSRIKLRQVTLPIESKGTVISYLQIAIPLTEAEEDLNVLRLVLSLAFPISLGIIGLVSYSFAKTAMEPIHQAHFQLERFTANASHELRTPLAVILSNAQVGLLSQSEQEQQRRLEAIAATCKTMKILVDNLLFLARHQGIVDADLLKPLDLTHHLQTIATQYAPKVTTKNLQWTASLPSESVWVIANADLLSQAVSNLLDNACQYTPPNGQIELKLSTTAKQAVIQVRDTGIGIAETDLPYVFERFYRVDKNRSRQSGGFGLGLAIVQQIATVHAGKVTVSSSLGKGSTFEVRLPLKHHQA
jgi:signal transduction histidine kinase